MRFSSQEDLKAEASRLRRLLEGAFRPDTAAAGFPGSTASAGQCAAVAAIVSDLLDVPLASARVKGLSHWFNRVNLESGSVDVDLTADQFGLPAIRIGQSGTLYHGTQLRMREEIDEDTRRRARLLAARAGLRPVLEAEDSAPRRPPEAPLQEGQQ